MEVAVLECSITNRCHLRCRECGFRVPDQPAPSAGGDVVGELAAALGHLARAGVVLDTLVIVGGEPTAAPGELARAVVELRAAARPRCLEVVSHGLSPQGLTAEVLTAIDRFVVSVYHGETRLLDLWQSWIAMVAPRVELRLRRHRDGWDPWTGDHVVDDARAQAMFDGCWYRRHCPTVERGRLFVCSRLAKDVRDGEGLAVTAATTLAEVAGYLGRATFVPGCRSCVPMMGLPTVRPGVQPDDRIARLVERAVACLEERLGAGAARA